MEGKVRTNAHTQTPTGMPRLVDQPDAAPTRKVSAAALGGALATVVVWALQAFGGVEVPPGVEGAVAVIIATLAGYVIREEDHPGTPQT